MSDPGILCKSSSRPDCVGFFKFTVHQKSLECICFEQDQCCSQDRNPFVVLEKSWHQCRTYDYASFHPRVYGTASKKDSAGRKHTKSEQVVYDYTTQIERETLRGATLPLTVFLEPAEPPVHFRLWRVPLVCCDNHR